VIIYEIFRLGGHGRGNVVFEPFHGYNCHDKIKMIN
jgi:hypothetical protein